MHLFKSLNMLFQQQSLQRKDSQSKFICLTSEILGSHIGPLKLTLCTLLISLFLYGCNSEETPTAVPTASPPTATTAPTEPPPAPTSEPGPSELTDIVSTAQNQGIFSTLTGAIEQADLVEKLSTAGPYTLFAPTDDAFAALPSGSLDDSDVVFDILLFHVVEGTYGSGAIQGETALTTLLGDEMILSRDGDTIRIGDIVLTVTDIEATNGVIHVVDTVLMPPSIEE